MAVAKTISTGGKWITYLGTYAEIVQALEDEKIPGHKVKGMSFTATGNCLVIVHKH